MVGQNNDAYRQRISEPDGVYYSGTLNLKATSNSVTDIIFVMEVSDVS